MNLIRAAGGVVWRLDGGAARVAVVHRPRRADWSLPKGKLDEGEGWEAAALREVREETGCSARLGRFAGSTSYLHGRTPKVALFWSMTVRRPRAHEPNDEVDEVRWLRPAVAIARLSYDTERRVLARAVAGRGARPRGEAAALRAEIDEVRAPLLRRALTGALGGAVLGKVLARLDEAEDAALAGRVGEARALLRALPGRP